jgi:hypothetical protein
MASTFTFEFADDLIELPLELVSIEHNKGTRFYQKQSLNEVIPYSPAVFQKHIVPMIRCGTFNFDKSITSSEIENVILLLNHLAGDNYSWNLLVHILCRGEVFHFKTHQNLSLKLGDSINLASLNSYAARTNASIESYKDTFKREMFKYKIKWDSYQNIWYKGNLYFNQSLNHVRMILLATMVFLLASVGITFLLEYYYPAITETIEWIRVDIGYGLIYNSMSYAIVRICHLIVIARCEGSNLCFVLSLNDLYKGNSFFVSPTWISHSDVKFDLQPNQSLTFDQICTAYAAHLNQICDEDDNVACRRFNVTIGLADNMIC